MTEAAREKAATGIPAETTLPIGEGVRHDAGNPAASGLAKDALSDRTQPGAVEQPTMIQTQQPSPDPRPKTIEGNLPLPENLNLVLLPIREEDHLEDGRIRIRVLGKNIAALSSGRAEQFAYNNRVRCGIVGHGGITGTSNPYPADENGVPLPAASQACMWAKEVYMTS